MLPLMFLKMTDKIKNITMMMMMMVSAISVSYRIVTALMMRSKHHEDDDDGDDDDDDNDAINDKHQNYYQHVDESNTVLTPTFEMGTFLVNASTPRVM